MEYFAILVSKLKGWFPIRWTISRFGYQVKPNRIGRQFLRVLNPSDAWIDERGGTEDSFKQEDGDLSVACQNQCNPLRVMAAYFGARAGMLPPSPLCYRFWEGEALQMSGSLHQIDPTPCPWPADYSAAHHDLSGDQDSMASGFLRIHRAFEDRRHPESQFDIYREMARLGSSTSVHPIYKKHSLKILKKLYHLDRERVWLPIAKEFNILLNDAAIQQEFRKLFTKGPNSTDRAQWNQMVSFLEVDPSAFNLK